MLTIITFASDLMSHSESPTIYRFHKPRVVNETQAIVQNSVFICLTCSAKGAIEFASACTSIEICDVSFKSCVSTGTLEDRWYISSSAFYFNGTKATIARVCAVHCYGPGQGSILFVHAESTHYLTSSNVNPPHYLGTSATSFFLYDGNQDVRNVNTTSGHFRNYGVAGISHTEFADAKWHYCTFSHGRSDTNYALGNVYLTAEISYVNMIDLEAPDKILYVTTRPATLSHVVAINCRAKYFAQTFSNTGQLNLVFVNCESTDVYAMSQPPFTLATNPTICFDSEEIICPAFTQHSRLDVFGKPLIVTLNILLI